MLQEFTIKMEDGRYLTGYGHTEADLPTLLEEAGEDRDAVAHVQPLGPAWHLGPTEQEPHLEEYESLRLEWEDEFDGVKIAA